jgi:hypothetical protein
LSCSCIKALYDFHVDPLDTNRFNYIDLSSWMDEPPYVIPPTKEVEITLPSGKVVFINIKPQDSTIITAQDLGLGQCLQDGIYCFKVNECSNCGNTGGKTYSKQVAILAKTECQVDNLMATEKDFKSISDLKAKLDQIKAVSMLGKKEEAADLFKILSVELKRYNCNSCGC